ncbi:MAG TPA: hypothetical protein VHF26_14410, partial [Trebonia sp.]|nr:hypothetical protein [Trebonia sp.]
MTPRYSFTRAARARSWRARWSRVPGRLARPGRHRIRPYAACLRTRRDRRKLAAIERALVTDAPGLSSMFTMFNQLNQGEEAAGAERVPAPAWPRPRPAYLAALLALAAVVALCLALAAQIRPAARA